MEKKILIIGAVWPEPNSSAAGSRMMQLIEVFLKEGYKITFATSTADSEYRYPIEDLGIEIKAIELNNDSFDGFVEILNPDIVLFDRFMTEEQFGWRVEKKCSNALRILDTEDLHCLRKARQQAYKEKREFSNKDLNTDIAKREIASIYRSDLTLMISLFEMNLLKEYFNIPEQLLSYLPFLLEPVAEKELLPSFKERINFVTIGSFRHDPNWDSVLCLKQNIWPVLRKKLPNAELHIFGSYPTEKAMQLHKPAENFFVNGWAKDAHAVLKNARVILAPLNFGAGLKGKFVDGMLSGTPNITTGIGAEAMHGTLPWSGLIAETNEEIIDAAVRLYSEEELWNTSQQNGYKIIQECYANFKFSTLFMAQLNTILINRKAHRNSNFIGSMLLFHTMRSTEFMSRWIAEKNK